MISGVVGGPAGTNYGENISTMAITKVYSIPVLIAASIIAIVISFFTPLIRIIYGIPTAVIGGLEMYLFGAIAAQGIAIMIEKKVDMFELQEHRRHRYRHGSRHRRPVCLRRQHSRSSA
jgi:uracil permease